MHSRQNLSRRYEEIWLYHCMTTLIQGVIGATKWIERLLLQVHLHRNQTGHQQNMCFSQFSACYIFANCAKHIHVPVCEASMSIPNNFSIKSQLYKAVVVSCFSHSLHVNLDLLRIM
jgi:hypothetical protein